jgi:hypothetical protein
MESHASRKPMTHWYITNDLLTSRRAEEKTLQGSPMFGFPGSSTDFSRSIGESDE